jgi:hypothetical protein
MNGPGMAEKIFFMPAFYCIASVNPQSGEGSGLLLEGIFSQT